MCSVLIWTSNVVKCNYFYISVTYFETIFQSRTIAVTGPNKTVGRARSMMPAFIHRLVCYKNKQGSHSVANREQHGHRPR